MRATLIGWQLSSWQQLETCFLIGFFDKSCYPSRGLYTRLFQRSGYIPKVCSSEHTQFLHIPLPEGSLIRTFCCIIPKVRLFYPECLLIREKKRGSLFRRFVNLNMKWGSLTRKRKIGSLIRKIKTRCCVYLWHQECCFRTNEPLFIFGLTNLRNNEPFFIFR